MISIAIQAGGRSSRMGRDKGLVQLGPLTLIEHVAKRLDKLGDEIIVTTNNPEDYAFLGLPLYADPQPGAGAAYGLQTALTSARGNIVIVAACDMPFIETALVRHMLDQLTADTDVVVPYRQGRFEPLLAIYRRRTCLEALTRALEAGQMRMIAFYSQVNVLKIGDDQLKLLDPYDLSFFNVNTPEDLAVAEGLISGHPKDPYDLDSD
jgi:molybdopterin-guanine dinucleotide biosynthesis protein A